MTKEEAIAELREDKALYESDICHAGDGTPDGRLLQALDMAIEALHREEAEEKGWCHRIRPRNMEVVVRCKDCRWWNSETKGCKRNPSVKAWQEDDFCKYGKRWSNAID